MTTERRTIDRAARIEQRDGGKRVLTGYASVFYRAGDPGTEYQMWPGCMERIMPGAFARALRENQDVQALFNHDGNKILGRTASGTCRLSEDSVGLRYEIDLPNTTDPPNLPELIERGDVSGSSFAFRASVVQWSDDGENEIRSIMDCDLFDVGPVGRPAYTGTTTGMRADDIEAVRAEMKRYKQQADAVAVRLRELELDDV